MLYVWYRDIAVIFVEFHFCWRQSAETEVPLQLHFLVSFAQLQLQWWCEVDPVVVYTFSLLVGALAAPGSSTVAAAAVTAAADLLLLTGCSLLLASVRACAIVCSASTRLCVRVESERVSGECCPCSPHRAPDNKQVREGGASAQAPAFSMHRVLCVCAAPSCRCHACVCYGCVQHLQVGGCERARRCQQSRAPQPC
jgi:hypothetical protein